MARLGDAQLLQQLRQSKPLGDGIGGSGRLLVIDGYPVFAKLVPLSELETVPSHFRATSNLFELPPHLHYGVGSPGFGAWRELAANEQASAWVRGGRCASFALLHHWRVLPMRDAARAQADEIESAVAYWHGDAALRARLQALATARASLVLFLEYVPQTLAEWLPQQAAAGRLDDACAMVEGELLAAVRCMGEHEMLHFDAHFRNILTDGRQLYLADLGLASSQQFELSAAERAFLQRHRQHDRAYVATQLVNALIRLLASPQSVQQRAQLLGRCAEGVLPADMPPVAAALLQRHAATALEMNAFYGALYGQSRLSPYPAEALRRCLQDLSD
ncbi:hypothetical protein [Paucibacter soli]|uniref:hypothetical protein n=1 Tax=Paucibacter soli TaxID=3133433 RepID=UPI0030A035A0